MPIVGLIVGWLLFVRLDFWRRSSTPRSGQRAAHRSCTAAGRLTSLYDALIVKPFVALARINKRDIVDLLFTGTAALSRLLHGALAADAERPCALVRREHGRRGRRGSAGRIGGAVMLAGVL